MKYLLDTHAFLWWVSDDPMSSSAAREAIADGANEVCFSVVLAWEIAIRHAIGRLHLRQPPKLFLTKQLPKSGFVVLGIRLDHALELLELPNIHSDPFDRLLIAQCRCDGFTLISCDRMISRYVLKRIW